MIAGDKTGFIITSRNALALDGVRSLRIDVFSEKKALDLLRAIVGKKGFNAELHKVAELCGRLPLACGWPAIPASQGRMDRVRLYRGAGKGKTAMAKGRQ